MDWNVKNALNRDVERQHLNKILAEIAVAVEALQKKASTSSAPSTTTNIKDTVGEMVQGNTEQGIAVNYDAINKVLNFAVANFTIALQGDVEGSAQVTSLGSVVIDTTIAADVGIADAPFDNSRYWRYNGGWEGVNDSIVTLSDLDGEGFPALTSSEGEAVWNLRELVQPAAGITITNPAGVTGDPTFALANDLAAVEGLATAGLAARTALDTWATRTITAGAGVTVSNGDGVAGNPTIAHADTSSVADLTSDNSGTTVLQDFTITFDTYGHVQTVTVGTVNVATALASVFQPLDATLTALAGVNWAANSLPIGSGSDTVAQITFAANTFPARASTGNLVAKAITDQALTLLGTTSTTNLPEGTNLYYTDARARTAVIAATITDSDTTHSPSGDAVFDALALKLNSSAVSSYMLTVLDDTTSLDARNTLEAMPLKLTVSGTNVDYTYISADANVARGKTTSTARIYTVDCSALTVGAYYYAANYASTGNITVTAAVGTTLRLTGTATTGDRTVGPFGIARIWIRSATEAWVDGPGVT